MTPVRSGYPERRGPKFSDAHLKLKEVVKEGKKPMPAFGKKLTEEQIDDVIAYIRTFAWTTAQK
jgi:mono/diheme cytochrome c family protein